jgi:predicted glycosyltransferase
LPEAVILSRCGFEPGDRRPRILIGMRGGTSAEAIVRGCRSMPEAVFTTLQAPPDGAPANLRPVSQDGLDFADLLAVHHAVISKFGYGVVCDAAAAGTRLLWPPRHGFREEEIFEVEAPRFLPTQRIERDDYAEGRWGESLRRLLALPRPATPPLDGEEATVRHLLSFVNLHA